MLLFAQQFGDLQGALGRELDSTLGNGLQPVDDDAPTMLGLLNAHAFIFLIAFAVTLFVTPLVRQLAVANNIIDHPDASRKAHPYPIAYLGGLAVFCGLIAAVLASYVLDVELPPQFRKVPIAVLVGMVAITFTGLADDVWGWNPRLKIMGQLIAAAALAIDNVGVRVAHGVLAPLFGDPQSVLFVLLDYPIIAGHVYYWTGTALIAVFVLGGCNATNFIDGLDGLCSGVVGIVALGLLAVSLMMAVNIRPGEVGDPTLAGARIVLCLALLGAVLGFLPHNFNPASIFLGDAGSLLLGYMCVVIILMLGEHGQTHLVFAGLIIFALPIMDATLAIIRRQLAGIPISAADDHHLHHQLKRALGGVKRAVTAMYSISLLFALAGVTLAALVTFSVLRIRVVYVLSFVLFSFIAMMAVKAARRKQWMLSTAQRKSERG